MINSIESTKKINRFEYVAIPSPRDVFNRYGERLSNNGEFSCGRELGSSPAIVSASSTIDLMINAHNMLDNQLSSV